MVIQTRGKADQISCVWKSYSSLGTEWINKVVTVSYYYYNADIKLLLLQEQKIPIHDWNCDKESTELSQKKKKCPYALYEVRTKMELDLCLNK